MDAQGGLGSPKAGWYADPMGRHQYRYWDGESWTSDVADSGVASVDPVSAPKAVDAAREPEVVPVAAAAVEAQATMPVAVAPARKKGRTGLVVAIVVAVVVLLAAAFGAVSSMSGVGSARAAATTAISRAETAAADAELCAEDGNDVAGLVKDAATRLAEAKAKMAAGSSFSAGPYREAKSLADGAASVANEAVAKVDAALAEAGSLSSSGSYQEAVQAWSGLASTYPRSKQAADAQQAALSMLTDDIPDASGVTLEDDLQLSIDVAAMYPSDGLPDELGAHVTAALVDEADSDLDTLQQVATANATWARELKSKGKISGSVVLAFQNQAFDSSDVERMQRIQGLMGTLGTSEQMTRLYSVLTNSVSLAAGCRSVADHPYRSTSTSRTFSNGQITSVRDKAAAMQRNLDECRGLVSSLSTTI